MEREAADRNSEQRQENSQTRVGMQRQLATGGLALALRGGLGKLVTMFSTVLLARLLAPADFGIFAILQLPIGWLNIMADAGVSAALVQKDELAPADEQLGFSLRMVLALAAGAALFLGAGLLGGLYGLAGSEVTMLRMLAAGPWLGALGTVPGLYLTRALRFDQLALAELGSLLAGQATALVLAWGGAGLWSLVAGSLVTVSAASLLVNLMAPWRPRFSLTALTRGGALLRFGLAFQGQGLAHLLKDQSLAALSGLAFSGTQVGYLSWAQDLARWPRIPADYAARLTFPAFARLQQDPVGLVQLLRKTLTLICWVSFVVVAVGLATGPWLIKVLFGAKWLPAVPALSILLLQTPLDALAAVLLPLIYATGRAGLGLRLSAGWAALTWLLGALALLWGDWQLLPASLAIGTLLAVSLIIRCLPAELKLSWSPILVPPLLVSLGLGGLVHGVMRCWIG